MEFNNENGAHTQNGSATATSSKAAQGVPVKKTNGIAPKAEAVNGKPEAEAAKPAPVNDEQPAPAEAKPVVEQPKEAEKPVLIVLNLEGTLKVVEDLHRRSLQRINLISRIKQLEIFQVNLATENDELEDNPYQGCKLIIKDDKNREFVTTTPGLIRLVSQFIFEACHKKLAEIEAAIILPKP
jgi:hypothetical protein